MIDYLSDKFGAFLNKVSFKSNFTEHELDEYLYELKLLLLDADVDYITTRDFINTVKQEILDLKLKEKLNRINKDILLSVVYEQLLKILGKTNYEIDFSSSIVTCLIVGLQGSGKTTTVAKLANLAKKKLKKTVLIVECDIYRPAAYEQLQTLSSEIGVDIFYEKNQKPQEIAQTALKNARKSKKYDFIIFNTAGRTSLDNDLLNEIKELNKIIKPHEVIFNVDATSGRDIINVGKTFNEYCKIDCAILTKFDSEAKSGAAFSITHSLKLPIAYIGTGEKIADIEKFYPKRVADRIMGRGDLKSFSEKINESMSDKDEARTKNLMRKMMTGNIDLEDLITQLKMVTKMGPLSKMASMLPGMPKLSKQQKEDGKKRIKLFETIANSTTLKERRNINLLDQLSRKKRIMAGSGISEQQYNSMLKQLKAFRKQTKMIKQMLGKHSIDKFTS